MSELGPHAQSYKDAFEQWMQNAERQAANRDAADIYDETMRSAELIMEIIDEDDETAQEFRSVLEPVADAATERDRKILESMLNDPTKRPSVVSRERIEARLKALPVPEVYSDQDQLLARAYFFGKLMTSPSIGAGVTVALADIHIAKDLTLSPEPEFLPPASPEATNGAEPEPAEPENDEADGRRRLEVKIYRNGVMVLGDDQVVSLRRSFASGTQTVKEEKLIQAVRLRVLEILAEAPRDKTFQASELWELAVPADPNNTEATKFNSSKWYRYIGDFLMDLSFTDEDGKESRLVDAQKPTPTAKRRYYKLGDFSLTFADINEDFEEETGEYFALPNGKLIRGLSGQVMHLLSSSTANNPLTEALLFEKGIFKKEDADKFPNRFSGIISSIRITLNNNDYEGKIVPVKLKEVRTSKNRPVFGYYIKGPDQEVSEAPIAEETGPEKEKAYAEAIHRAHIVARHIHNRRDLLAKVGLMPMDEMAWENLKNSDELAAVVEENEEVRHQYRDAAFDELSKALADDRIEEFLDELDPKDPRNKLVEYLFDLMSSDKRDEFWRCFRARVVDSDGQRGPDGQLQDATWIEYSVPGVGAVRVTRQDEAPMTNDALDSLGPKANGNGHSNGHTPTANGADIVENKPDAEAAPRLTNRERRQQRSQIIERGAVQPIREALNTMNTHGLMDGRPKLVKELKTAFPELPAEVYDRHLNKLETPPTTPELSLRHILHVFVAENGSDDLKQAISTREGRRTLQRIIQREEERFRHSEARRFQALQARQRK